MLISDGFLNSNCCKKKKLWITNKIENQYLWMNINMKNIELFHFIICVFYFAEIRHPMGKDFDATTGADKFSKT